jgi:hypothetical protein
MTAVVVKLQGGLGNQMFQYAAGRAAALRRKAHLYLDLHGLLDRRPRDAFTFRDYELSAFRVDQRFASREGLEWSRCVLLDRLLARLGRGPLAVPQHHAEALPGPLQRGVIEGQGHLLLDGLWQDPRYFEDHADAIRQDFTLWQPWGSQVRRLADELAASECVCLHVRRTDFVADPVMSGLGVDYYRRALAQLQERHGALPFLVFSDDLGWCRENLGFVPDARFVTLEEAGGSVHAYQALMSQCLHFVIPNSTFSWWAAYLCSRPGKSVVAPRGWYRGGGIEAYSANVCPSSWTLI